MSSGPDIAFIDLKSQYAALKQDIDARIQRVLDHGQYIMGPEVRELEERLQTWSGASHCVTVSIGTEALLIALMALAGATALDVVCARNLTQAPLTPPRRIRIDYGRRSGFPEPPEAMRGRAKDFKPPLDIVGPEAMRAWTTA